MNVRRHYDDVPVVDDDQGFIDEPLQIGEEVLDVEHEEGDESRSAEHCQPVARPSWSPSGNFWKDAWYFVGPGWLVSIAYIDPGNFQADISAGGTTR
jgi:hypothetical protein